MNIILRKDGGRRALVPFYRPWGLLDEMDTLARDAARLHFYSLFRRAWEKLGNFHSIVNARCSSIGSDNVTYTDADGKEQSIKAGSVVIAVGMKPRDDLALKFSDAGERFYMIGDCDKAGNIQKAIRSGFAIGSQI